MGQRRLQASLGGELIEGGDLVLDTLGFDARAAQVDLVVTGEGKLDQTTLEGKAPGSVMTVQFELDGQPFVALNAGRDFKFNESISFQIDCADQAEVDYYWERLGDGGQYSQCGWLTDKFGLSWQIVPERLPQLLGDPDRVVGYAAFAFSEATHVGH